MVDDYFDHFSFSLINSSIYQCLIKDPHHLILNKGLPELLQTRDYKSLILLYSFVLDTDLVSNLKNELQVYIFD
jgi:hypothetical protein